jgi:hypothetical protein
MVATIGASVISVRDGDKNPQPEEPNIHSPFPYTF